MALCDQRLFYSALEKMLHLTRAVIRATFLIELLCVYGLPPGSVWFLQESDWHIK